MMAITSADLWERFEAMLTAQSPALLASLRPGATMEQIEAAEQTMQVQLPADVRYAYLRHDGTGEPLFPPFCHWASLTEMVEKLAWSREYDAEMRLEYPDQYGPPFDYWDTQKVKPIAGNDLWIPIGLSNTSTTVCIDLDPAPKGVVGQLIVDHGMCEPYELASSFDQFLAFLIDRVERGILIYRDWQWVWTETDDSTFDWDLMRKQ